MKKILITSDKYSFCLDGYQKLLNRHWQEEGVEFTVLGFAEPRATLQENFTFQSFGGEFNDASPWVDALMTYFPNLKEDYFFLCFEDHYLIGDVNVKMLQHAEKIMQEDKSIGKVRLLPHYQCDNKIGGEYDEHFNFYFGRENIVSTTSLRPSIWRKDYFIQLLTNPSRVMNPGQFEDKNQAMFLADTKMLIPKGSDPLYPDIDAFRKGNINQVPISGPGVIDMDEYKLYIDQEDVDVFRSNISTWENRKMHKYDVDRISEELVGWDNGKYYGQWETDKVIESYFPDGYNGACIEVGAANGIKGSNTLYFEERGWDTLCIEPNPEHSESLEKHRKLVRYFACDEKSGALPLTIFRVGEKNITSSLTSLFPDDRLVKDHKSLINEAYKIDVKVETLSNIIQNEVNGTVFEKLRKIDFISIDTEGTELNVLKGLDFSLYDVTLLIIENNYDDKQIEDFMISKGYRKDKRYKINDFYVKGT